MPCTWTGVRLFLGEKEDSVSILIDSFAIEPGSTEVMARKKLTKLKRRLKGILHLSSANGNGRMIKKMRRETKSWEINENNGQLLEVMIFSFLITSFVF